MAIELIQGPLRACHFFRTKPVSRILGNVLGLPLAGGPICLEGQRLSGVLIVLLIRKVQVRILAPQPSFQQVSLPG